MTTLITEGMETITLPETPVTDLPSIDLPHDPTLVHLARHPFKHAFCGVEVDPNSRGWVTGTEERDCEACIAIAQAQADGHGWEGFGKRPPGKQTTKEVGEWLRDR